MFDSAAHQSFLYNLAFSNFLNAKFVPKLNFNLVKILNQCTGQYCKNLSNYCCREDKAGENALKLCGNSNNRYYKIVIVSTLKFWVCIGILLFSIISTSALTPCTGCFKYSTNYNSGLNSLSVIACYDSSLFNSVYTEVDTSYTNNLILTVGTYYYNDNKYPLTSNGFAYKYESISFVVYGYSTLYITYGSYYYSGIISLVGPVLCPQSTISSPTMKPVVVSSPTMKPVVGSSPTMKPIASSPTLKPLVSSGKKWILASSYQNCDTACSSYQSGWVCKPDTSGAFSWPTSSSDMQTIAAITIDETTQQNIASNFCKSFKVAYISPYYGTVSGTCYFSQYSSYGDCNESDEYRKFCPCGENQSPALDPITSPKNPKISRNYNQEQFSEIENFLTLNPGSEIFILIILWSVISFFLAFYFYSRAIYNHQYKRNEAVFPTDVENNNSLNGNSDSLETSETATVSKRKMYENEPGLSKTIEEYTERPDEILTRLLFNDEVVLDQFDVYFPTEMTPTWKIILFCIITGGLYLLYLAWKECVKFCYRIKCCSPSLYVMGRGKMAVTNMGRIIVWEQNLVQIKEKESCSKKCIKCLFCACFFPDSCKPPMKYEIMSQSQIYKVERIRQVSQFYSSSGGCGCCCNSYNCGIKVSLNSFIDDGLSDPFISTSASNAQLFSFIGKFQQWTNRSLHNFLENVLTIVGGTMQNNVLYIISDSTDKVHNGDLQSVFDDIYNLYARLNKSFLKFVATTNSFESNPCSVLDLKMTNKVKDVTIVGDYGEVEIPYKFLPLMEDEKVLNSVGLIYYMTFWDYYFMFFLFGYPWFFGPWSIAKKKSTRSAIILTTKRLLNVQIIRTGEGLCNFNEISGKGKIPSHLSNVEILVTCYYPGNISNGLLYSPSHKYLESSISTDAGTIKIVFPSLGGTGTRLMYLEFAKSLQMASRRKQNNAFTKDSTIRDKFIINSNDGALDYADTKILPLLEGEKTIDLIFGGKEWQGFCNCCGLLPFNLCDKSKFAGDLSKPLQLLYFFCCFPGIPYLFSCALRPFRNMKDIILTNHTVFQYIRVKNYGICGCCGPIRKVEPFFWPCDGSSLICESNAFFLVSWASTSDLYGHTAQYHYDGDENCLSRCCKNNYCGEFCCPVNKASFDLVIHTNNVDYTINAQRDNENWKLNVDRQRAEKNIGLVELKCIHESKNKSSDNTTYYPQKAIIMDRAIELEPLIQVSPEIKPNKYSVETFYHNDDPDDEVVITTWKNSSVISEWLAENKLSAYNDFFATQLEIKTMSDLDILKDCKNLSDLEFMMEGSGMKKAQIKLLFLKFNK